MQVTDWTPSQIANMEIITVESLYGANNEDGQLNELANCKMIKIT